MKDKVVRVGVLVSGSGSNLQALIDSVSTGYIRNARVALVISSRADAFALERARKAEIEAIFLNPKDFGGSVEYSQVIAGLMSERVVDLVCLAGFMRKIEKPLLERYPRRMMNIHPALLPKFGGKGMYGHYVHEAVLRAGEKESGPTVHFVDEQYDHGLIILQRRVPVMPDDTPETLAKRVLEQEHKIYPEAVKLFCEDRLEVADGKVIIK